MRKRINEAYLDSLIENAIKSTLNEDRGWENRWTDKKGKMRWNTPQCHLHNNDAVKLGKVLLPIAHKYLAQDFGNKEARAFVYRALKEIDEMLEGYFS